MKWEEGHDRFSYVISSNNRLSLLPLIVIVENLIGHAAIARKGITQALSELVSDDWIALNNALELADDLMYKNAERLFK